MNISPFLAIESSGNEVLQWASERLRMAGLRPVRTFDLHAARAGSHDCGCPNHGTEECDCQMVVMLVYGKAEEPVTLILHGDSRRTWLSLVDRPRQGPEIELSNDVRQALAASPAA